MANNILDKAIDFVFLLLARQSSNEFDSALAAFVGCRLHPDLGTAFRFSLSSISCHLLFGNHAKTDIFPHNTQLTFEAAVQRSGVSYLLTVDMKPDLFDILFWWGYEVILKLWDLP